MGIVSGLSAVDETIRMPPGPRLPRFMQTLGFIFVTRRFVDGCRRRYGDAVTFSTLFDPCFVMVLEPSLLKQVFRGSPEQLRAGEANAPLDPSSANARCCCSTGPSIYGTGGSCCRPSTASGCGHTRAS